MAEHQPDVRGLIAAQTELGVQSLARANKAEKELAKTLAVMAEHVEENLRLHARCAELERQLAEMIAWREEREP